jgi:hypothetical protein
MNAKQPSRAALYTEIARLNQQLDALVAAAQDVDRNAAPIEECFNPAEYIVAASVLDALRTAVQAAGGLN